MKQLLNYWYRLSFDVRFFLVAFLCIAGCIAVGFWSASMLEKTDFAYHPVTHQQMEETNGWILILIASISYGCYWIREILYYITYKAVK